MKEADKEKQLDLAPLRRKLQNKQGKQYWRSLEELAETDEFRQLVENEFPSSPLDWDKGLSRRRFLQVMGASLALAGLNGCTRQPSEMIFPYVVAPEEFIPGKPLFYATAVTPRVCWLKATWDGPRRLRATLSIRRAWARRTFSHRLRCCNCMIRTARRW